MRRNGEIIIIEDDEDDRMLLQDIFESLNYANKITFIEDPMDALSYLANPLVTPFIILSDINMPKINGFELRDQILADDTIRTKCVPYIFLSTSKTHENVLKAYGCRAQGYFKKEDDFMTFKTVIKNIVEYWRTSLTPTNSL
ncbi:CheY-like chemotaxis protein [Flavobacterium sp. 2755]|uniref:response regulator n=1 Tax=Flavobacterium sp. 2755 TaxID=2817765 RepID=UPI002861B72D|nr:response regulator [Flavobacterium sp. 2755]MDR6764422.1 CheY-like chemotaxis protein [Flavobacterium sp. 2755]